jgi:hypothetical protein
MAALTIGIGSNAAIAKWVSDEKAIMSTSVSVSLWHEDRASAERAIEAVMACVASTMHSAPTKSTANCRGSIAKPGRRR